MTQDHITELVNLYHTARIALSGKPCGRWERMMWATDEFCKAHPDAIRKRVYLELEGALQWHTETTQTPTGTAKASTKKPQMPYTL